MSSITTSNYDEKDKEVGTTSVSPAFILPVVLEEDADEALKLVGETRNEITQEEDDAVRRKLDRLVVPILASVYFSQFLDKTSLNYASVMGLPITGPNYSLVALAFYVGFLIFEIPTTMLAQKSGRVAKYLGINIVLWATVLILHAAAPTFGPFFALRFLLGAFESCVTPILIALIAAFYKRDEQSKRIGAFYVQNGFTQILGGISAYCISLYPGTVIAPWRIIYILFGGMAYAVGISVLIWLPDSPATAMFLTERERIVAIERVRDNMSGTVGSRKFKKDHAIEAFTDVKTYLIILITATLSTPNGGLSNFTSILIKSFGFTSQQALLLNAPQGAIAVITTLSITYWADKKQQRMLPILGAVIPTILGAAMLVGFSTDLQKYKAGSLVGIFLTSCFGSALAIIYSWSATNCAGSSKKYVTNALILLSFALGNVAGTKIFPATDAPNYLPGKISLLVLFTTMIFEVLALRWVNIRQNEQKAIKLAALIEANGWTEEDVKRESDRAAFLDLTDKQNPFFVYLP